MKKQPCRFARALEKLENRDLLAAVDALRISEIMYHPADPTSGAFVADDYEFLEFVNTGATPVNLSGVLISNGINFNFRTSAITNLAAGERVLVVKNVAAFEARYGAGLPVAGAFGGQLSNTDDTLVVTDFVATVQTVTYDDGWRPVTDGDGFSLVAIDPAVTQALWSDPANYRGSQRGGGSPGGVEAPLSVGDIVINEVLAHTDEAIGDWIELHNTTDQPLNLADWYLSDKGTELNRYRIAGDQFIPANGYLTFEQFEQFDNEDDPGTLVPFGLSEHGESVFLSSYDSNGLTAAYQISQDFRASQREVSFGRYTLSTGEVVFVEQSTETKNAANDTALVGPIVISEINYNEPGAGNTHEFIELYNPTDAPVLLYDPLVPANTWKFDRGIDFTFPTGVSIPAKGYLVLAAVSPAQFLAANEVPDDAQIFGPWLGSLDKNGEAVTLSRPGDPELDLTVPYYRTDHVSYGDKAPWPTEPDGNGPSLVRVAADKFGNDPISWKAGTKVGGTPGRGESAITLPGDTNGDGVVDLVDLNNVRNNFGSSGAGVVGDTDGNGTVDLVDLNAVRNNFGASLPASSNAVAAAAPRTLANADSATSPRLAAKQHAKSTHAADAALGELLHEWTLAGVSQKLNGRNAKRS